MGPITPSTHLSPPFRCLQPQGTKARVFPHFLCPLQPTLGCETTWICKTQQILLRAPLLLYVSFLWAKKLMLHRNWKQRWLLQKYLLAGFIPFQQHLLYATGLKQQRLFLSWNSHSETCLRCFSGNVEEELLIFFSSWQWVASVVYTLQLKGKRETLCEAWILKLGAPLCVPVNCSSAAASYGFK